MAFCQKSFPECHVRVILMVEVNPLDHKKEVGKRLVSARKRMGLKQADAATKIGVHYSTLAKYESGTRDPDGETLANLAKLYDVTTDYLLGSNKPSDISMFFEQRMIYEGKMFPYGLEAPTVGKAHAGWPTETITEDANMHPLAPTVKPSSSRNWIEVEGDCMDGGQDPIRPGYLVLVDTEKQFTFGDVVVVVFKDEYHSMLRIVRKLSNGTVLLEAANTQYDPIILDGREDIGIYGVVIDVSQNWQGRKKKVKETEDDI